MFGFDSDPLRGAEKALIDTNAPLLLPERLTAAIARIRVCEQNVLDRPLSAWSLTDDRHVPQMYLARPVRDLLTLTYEELENTPSLGRTRIEKLVEVMERINSGGDSKPFRGSNSERRFLDIQAELSGSDATALARPFESWVLATDSHLPQSYLRRSLSEILSSRYEQLVREPGVGAGKIERVLDVLERCAAELNPDRHPIRESPPSDSGGRQTTVENITETEWRKWCDRIRLHRLERDNLGRYAGCLNDLPQGLWTVPLGEYANRSLHAIRALPNHGPVRVSDVLKVFARIFESIRENPVEGFLSVRLFAPQIRDVVLWAEGILRSGGIPDEASIRAGFLTPIFALLEEDLGRDKAAMLRRRMGLDGPVETLEQIAIGAGVTRERIRQIAAKAASAIEVRWPEGRYLLDGVYTLFKSSPDADGQIDLLRGVFDACFSIDVVRESSRSDVLAAWDRAGRAKLTPMTRSAVRSWAGGEFPAIPANAVLNGLEEHGLRRDGPDGEDLYYTNDPLDKLLLHLISIADPMPLAELTGFLEGDERNAKMRLERDPRFVEDEFKRVTPAERCGFRRVDGRWTLRLEPAGVTAPRDESIAVIALIHLIVGGLTHAGICDATVWGVHRFAGDQLAKLFGAKLPAALTPFVLARMFVVHSDGLVRPMRRRRLRWDAPRGSIRPRGKCGWVDHVATTAGVPLTFDELDAALRVHFQDYEWYVLKQLDQLDDEEGETEFGYQYLQGVSNAVPGMLIPAGWEFDSSLVNVSAGVRLAVAKLVRMSKRAPVPKGYLRRIPWMIRLCEVVAPATMRWSEEPIPEDLPGDICQSPPIPAENWE